MSSPGIILYSLQVRVDFTKSSALVKISLRGKMSSRSLLKNINLINIILIIGLVVFVVKFVIPSYRADLPTTPPTTETTVIKKGVIKGAVQKELPQLAEYTIIAEDNLFHPDRKLVVSKGGGNQTSQEPEFVLYGILLAEDVKVAYMEDLKSPYTTQGRGRRQRAVHIGEELSGYVLSEIYSDKVVMTKGDERKEVSLLDLTHKRKGKPGKLSKGEKKPPVEKKKKPVSHLGRKRRKPFISRHADSKASPDKTARFRGLIKRESH